MLLINGYISDYILYLGIIYYVLLRMIANKPFYSISVIINMMKNNTNYLFSFKWFLKLNHDIISTI